MLQPKMNKKMVENIIKEIREYLSMLNANSTIKIMEVCGTHTTAIARAGLRSLLPSGLELLSGPGCPVCVTDQYDIEFLLKLAEEPGITLATFGDMMNVPGYNSSLAQKKTEGADVRIVTSPLQALKLAEENPDREIVFIAIGFETTVPLTAVTLESAINREIENFSLLSFHKSIIPAMKFLLAGGETKIDGFLCPGHVSTIIGVTPYNFIGEYYQKPCVVSGFEAGDILESILLLCKQLQTASYRVENQYRRAVREKGNDNALKLINKYFRRETVYWRGLGQIEASGLVLKDNYSRYDVIKKYNLSDFTPEIKKNECICGQILKGIKKPIDCPLFEIKCTPEDPLGPCMVSSEGACAASYYYRGGM